MYVFPDEAREINRWKLEDEHGVCGGVGFPTS